MDIFADKSARGAEAHRADSGDASGGRRSRWPAIVWRLRTAPSAGKVKRRLARMGKWLLWIGLMLLVVHTFIGEASVVPTASMEGTILVGDHLLWNKAQYGPEIP